MFSPDPRGTARLAETGIGRRPGASAADSLSLTGVSALSSAETGLQTRHIRRFPPKPARPGFGRENLLTWPGYGFDPGAKVHASIGAVVAADRLSVAPFTLCSRNSRGEQ